MYTLRYFRQQIADHLVAPPTRRVQNERIPEKGSKELRDALARDTGDGLSR